MKKFITLVLVLVLALGLTVPAMAFTSDSEAADDSVPYGLKVYLVEYDDNDLFGIATLPESDRGYAKNEIVAAIVELEVPEDEDIFDDGYTKLDISGDNVSFDVTDNDGGSDLRTSGAPALVAKTDKADGFKLTITSSNLPDDETYKWLVFAKVTDDEASITAKLIDGDGVDDFASDGTLDITLDGVDYTITNTDDGTGDFQYIIDITDGGDYEGAQIIIDVDEDNVSLGMSIDPYALTGDLPERALGVNTKNELGIVVNAKIETGDDAEDYLDIYNDVVVDVFGMDYMLLGNYVRDSFFEGLTSSDTVVATVDIEPWTAYVTVPDNIVVDPPKTGDAASIMGFVMVALSGAGVVALRKRG